MAGNKSPALLLKKPLCTGDISPMRKIFIERPKFTAWISIIACKQKQKTKVTNKHSTEINNFYFLVLDFFGILA